jgi:hypothetical protein
LTPAVIFRKFIPQVMCERVTFKSLTESNRVDVLRFSRRILLSQISPFLPLPGFARRILAQHFSAGQSRAARFGQASRRGDFELNYENQNSDSIGVLPWIGRLQHAWIVSCPVSPSWKGRDLFVSP